MPGPIRKPTPKAMPITPNDLARFSGSGHIGDVGLRERQIAGRQSIDDARQKHQPERTREARIRKPMSVPHLADDQQRLAAHVIGHAAENGPGDQLAERVGRNQQAHHRGRCAQCFRRRTEAGAP